jgi:hypothetical protein
MSLSCKLSVVLLIVIALLLIGCGSNATVTNSNLTPAQAQTVAQGVSAAVSQALLNAYSSMLLTAPAPSFLKARKGMSGIKISMSSPQPSPAVCTGDDSNTQCTVNYTGQCTGGGTVAITGSGNGGVNTSGSGSAKASLQLVPKSCDVPEYKIVLDGQPNITLASQVTIVNNDPSSWPVVLTETGAVNFGPDSGSSTVPTGSCNINMTYSFTKAGACTMGGTMCGQSVSGVCY